MKINKFISRIEKKIGVTFSVLHINNICDLYSFLVDKNLTKEYERASLFFEKKEEIVNCCIFSTKQPFYIEVYSSDGLNNIWNCNLYYQSKDENEFKVFIKKLKKELYERDDIRRIETKDR
jgi:hypothetical protein